MTPEICVRCKKEGIPWEHVPELHGHLCYDCSVISSVIKKYGGVLKRLAKPTEKK